MANNVPVMVRLMFEQTARPILEQLPDDAIEYFRDELDQELARRQKQLATVEGTIAE